MTTLGTEVGQELRRRAHRLGSELATQRGLSLRDAFDESLQGDLARMQVTRRLYREHPELPRTLVRLAVEEMLEP